MKIKLIDSDGYLIRLFLLGAMLGAIVSLLFIACTEAIDPSVEDMSGDQATEWTQLGNKVPGYGFFRYSDVATGVMCWVYVGGGDGTGISCLLLEETNLQ